MDWLALYLEEDLGDAGDITSDTLFAPGQQGAARVVTRQGCVVAGVAAAAEVFARRGAHADAHVADGERVEAGTVLLVVAGPVRGILSAERTALNIIGRMCGIATVTRHMSERLAAAGSKAVVAGTRKTTPGFRFFEKEAIRIGGGDPHRMGLYDAMMVKDNHLAAAGSMQGAVARLRAAHPDKLLEVEVESEADATAAAAAGADWILIDNQSPGIGAQWAQTVRDASPATKIEASGGITQETLLHYAWADRISLGWLTHSATSIDIGLDWGTP